MPPGSELAVTGDLRLTGTSTQRLLISFTLNNGGAEARLKFRKIITITLIDHKK